MEAPRSRQIAFDGAFGKTIAAYVGKPAAREGGSANKAMVVHGLDDVEGARELAPNLGIYRGGAAAAAERVQGGHGGAARLPVFYWALRVGPGRVGEGRPRRRLQTRRVLARRRAEAALGLPKPLWHEVADMLGGSSADVSARGAARRSDRQLKTLNDVREDPQGRRVRRHEDLVPELQIEGRVVAVDIHPAVLAVPPHLQVVLLVHEAVGLVPDKGHVVVLADEVLPHQDTADPWS